MAFPSDEELVEFYTSVARGDCAAAQRFFSAYPVDSYEMRGVLQLGLSFAAMVGKVPMIDFFLQKGADINAPDEDGDTPLIAAVRMGRVSSVTFLLEKGADVYRRGWDGVDAHDLAVQKGKTQIAAMLEAHIMTRPVPPLMDPPAVQKRAADRQAKLRRLKPPSPFGKKGGPKP